MDKIKELWGKNRDEIIDSVINIKQIEMQGKETEIEEKMERERKTIKLQLTIGIVYVLAGVILFRHLEQENLFTVEKQYTAVSFELLLLGIYEVCLQRSPHIRRYLRETFPDIATMQKGHPDFRPEGFFL